MDGATNGRTFPHTGSSLRVLVVEDNPDAADLLAIVVELAGHETRVAYDGPPALAIAETFEPEAVLLDLGLPAMDGYEVARRLRQRPGTRDALLAAVTAWGQPEDRRRAVEAGFDHHLVKPVPPEQILEVLERARTRRLRMPSSGPTDL